MAHGLGECEHASRHMQITHSLLLSTVTLAIVSSVLSWPENRMALKGSLHLSTRAYTYPNAMMPKAPMHVIAIMLLTIGCRVLFSKLARVVPTVDQINPHNSSALWTHITTLTKASTLSLS